MSRLVDELLLLAKSEQTQFLRIEPIDLATFVSELWDGVSLIADRRFELAPIPQGTLRADPDRLAQALRNLLDNAIEHTSPQRGLVRLQVIALAAQRVRFVVEDDGPGIGSASASACSTDLHRTDDARGRASGGPAWAWRSCVRSPRRTAARSPRANSPEGGARMELELAGFTRLSAAAGRGSRSRRELAEDAGVPDRVAAGLRPHA